MVDLFKIRSLVAITLNKYGHSKLSVNSNIFVRWHESDGMKAWKFTCAGGKGVKCQ